MKIEDTALVIESIEPGTEESAIEIMEMPNDKIFRGGHMTASMLEEAAERRRKENEANNA